MRDQDTVSSINRTYMNSDIAVYLCPVVFCLISANVKNAIDRRIPIMLPFFQIKPDKSTMHPPRYDKHPKTIMIGYGHDLSMEDEQLFIDITKNHRTNVGVLIYRERNKNFINSLNSLHLKRQEHGYERSGNRCRYCQCKSLDNGNIHAAMARFYCRKQHRGREC